MVIGDAPKMPLQKRHIMTVAVFFPAPTPREKTENPNIPIAMGRRRPAISEYGAQKMGPVAKPRTYSETPRVPTVCETPNSAEKALMPAEKRDELNPTVKVENANGMARRTLEGN
jgi:hypothetical protein